ncbi:MAG: VWA domain-containing protein [Deltaproteobacteria bacterium]|nr:VWA domain-containing protein [Deltaproteobacteria bacterium]
MHRPIAAALLLLAGCSEYDIIDFEEVDVFFQNPAEEVDILMVVDNSCSMGPYQLALGANFNQFITYFIDANIDYHIGVTTTTIQRPEYTSLIPSCTQADLDEIPNAGHLAQATVIDNNTSGAASLFQDLVNVGTCGSGFEMGLEAAMVALSPPVLATANIGFLREEASLSIILVSDEEDNSPDPVNEYINTYFGVKGHRERDPGYPLRGRGRADPRGDRQPLLPGLLPDRHRPVAQREPPPRHLLPLPGTQPAHPAGDGGQRGVVLRGGDVHLRPGGGPGRSQAGDHLRSHRHAAAGPADLGPLRPG